MRPFRRAEIRALRKDLVALQASSEATAASSRKTAAMIETATEGGRAMLTETYKIYEGAQPLNAPSWFPCFDAGKIGDALESGEAVAFLSQANIAPDVDRVVAIFPDGRAFAWQQFHPGAGE